MSVLLEPRHLGAWNENFIHQPPFKASHSPVTVCRKMECKQNYGFNSQELFTWIVPYINKSYGMKDS